MSQPSLKIGVSGVRGIAGVSLTPQIVASFAAAFGTYCGPRRVVVGSDTRPSREMVNPAVIAGLLSVGCTPVDLGVVPVPTLQYHLRKIGAAGGICITASHNPMEWNALKFCGSDGITLRAHQFAELLDLYHQGVYPRVSNDGIPSVEEDASALDDHFAAVRSLVDGDRIGRRGLRVVVDCCNGAASKASPAFLKSLGCRVVGLHTSPGKPFPRDPEPTRHNLGDLCGAVLDAHGDIGFAQDADADRVAVVNERGEPLGEDCTIALAVRSMLEKNPGPVVVNASTSRMVDDIAAEAGVPVHRTRVGEANVLERMIECASPVGGEGNGGVIVPAVNPCRDSFVAMALILEMVASTGATIGEIREGLPRYHIIKEKVPCRSRDAVTFLRLMKYAFRDEQLDFTDGIKVVWPEKWLHIRGSNTEAILRVVAEARQEEEARELVERAMEYFRPIGQ
jgi:phosphomannomutase